MSYSNDFFSPMSNTEKFISFIVLIGSILLLYFIFKLLTHKEEKIRKNTLYLCGPIGLHEKDKIFFMQMERKLVGAGYTVISRLNLIDQSEDEDPLESYKNLISIIRERCEGVAVFGKYKQSQRCINEIKGAKFSIYCNEEGDYMPVLTVREWLYKANKNKKSK